MWYGYLTISRSTHSFLLEKNGPSPDMVDSILDICTAIPDTRIICVGTEEDVTTDNPLGTTQSIADVLADLNLSVSLQLIR